MRGASKPLVLIDGRLIAYRRGGIPRYAAALAEWMPRVAPDLDFRLVANRPTDSPIPLARVRTPPHFRLERETVSLELARQPAAVLHSTDFIAPRFARYRRVVTIHDLAFLEHPEILDEPSRRYYGRLRASLRAADRIVAVSQYTAERLLHHFDVRQDRVTVIHNGVDCDRFGVAVDDPVSVLREELGVEAAAFVTRQQPLALLVGTVEPRKRQGLVLDLLEDPLLRQVSFVVVGQSGWNSEELQARLRAAERGGRLLWLRSAGDRALAALYAAATVALLPSLDEGFGLTALEAMATGLPVIAAAAGALPEVIGEAGVLLRDADPAEWASALGEVIRDDAWRSRLALAGRARAADFSWRETALATAEVYRKALA